MSWKHLGTEGFGRLIEANDDLAALLARRCAGSDDFEAIPDDARALGRLLPPPARRARGRRSPCHPATSTPTRTDSRPTLEASGDGWLTTTRLRGSTWLRAGIVNYLSTEADIDRLLATLRRLAGEYPSLAERRLERLGDLGREAADAGAPSRARVVRMISEAPARP